MRVKFAKMHGAGNDFVMIDDRSSTFPISDTAFVRRLANRPDGIGCEGVILVRSSETADFAMRFLNPDGSEADLCGNGARCVAAFARAIGAAVRDEMTFETRAGRLTATILKDGLVRIAMPEPRDLDDHFINTGVPHLVVPTDDLAGTDVLREGRRLRFSETHGPEGANVDFVRYVAPDTAYIRTYERGVEAETFACGTGAVAAAVVGVARHALAFPVRVTTVRGDTLVIDGERIGDAFHNLTLTGPVKTIFTGEIDLAPSEPNPSPRNNEENLPCI